MLISIFLNLGRIDCLEHRIRIKTEEKAKVVASVWGAEFTQFLAAQVFLHWMI